MKKHYLQYRLPIVDDKGYYGQFGGSYVPDALVKNLDDLAEAFCENINDETFREEFDRLLHDYAGRPTPLYFSEFLSDRYGCKIYLKREDLNHTGAHKINNAIGQALLAKRMGKKRLIAETGAGQHGVATATVAALLCMDCTIYMGAEDVRRQHPNVMRMKMLGADVVAVSDGNGTLSNAVDKALAQWREAPNESFYLLGSAVGPNPYPEVVARFQSVISHEIRKQLAEKEGRELPDCVIACIGGGSNAAGAFYNFIESPEVRLVAVEAAGRGLDSGKTAASLSIGKPTELHGARTMVLTDNEGSAIDAYSVSSGLDYPGVGPLHAYLASVGRMDVVTVEDSEALDAAKLLARGDGIIPALESSHALAALEKLTFKGSDVVVLNLSGRGDKDMGTYLDTL